MNFEEKVIKTQPIYRGAILNLDLEDVLLPNGKTAKREIIHHHGAVAVMPIDQDGKMIFVRQWRAPMQKETLEIPAGKIDLGEKDPHKVALRELNEETGLYTDQLQHVTDFYSTPGFADEFLHLYYSDQLQKVTHKRSLDPDEFLNVSHLTFAEANDAKQAGLICDAKTIMALYYWEILRLKGAVRLD
ncbi:NUDIX hydrolase [Agrilactobacillus fermenti]|uniref:NUDIX hydrolase n=1 Tax=Agrilactobacillus fermenti TaxID=2586909 RepID=UPI001E2E69E2|nr:NUDIX hydrolase [Agrilactobacillus fermenti]MCD2255298.1 NUDIX hydrolase [Agrilactobacillus fermenti]